DAFDHVAGHSKFIIAASTLDACYRYAPRVLLVFLDSDCILGPCQHLSEGAHPCGGGVLRLAHHLFELGAKARDGPHSRGKHASLHSALNAVAANESGMFLSDVSEFGYVDAVTAAVVIIIWEL